MESVCTGNCTAGSNPALSAIYNYLTNYISMYPFIVFCLVIAALPGQRLDQGENGQTTNNWED